LFNMKSFLRPSRVITSVTLLALLFISNYTLTYTNNPPTAKTGAPGEGDCTDCHSGTAITSGTEFKNLTISTNMVDDEYVPDSTYKVTVSYVESGKSKFGFSATALKSSDNSMAGDFTVLSSTTTATDNATVNSKSREYIHQKSGGTSGSGKIDWTFEWEAPDKNEGDVKFYIALNSSNSNSSTGGDKIVLKDFVIPASSRLPEADIKTSSLTVCAGDTLLLDGTGSKKALSYKWKTNGGTQKNLTDSAIKVVWTTTGTKNVRLVASNALGDSKEESVSIKVIAKTPITVTQTDSVVCNGESIFLEASGSVTGWKWNTNETSNKIEVFQSGIYTVEGTAANGCVTKSKEFDLTILPKTSITLSTNGRDTFCSNESVTLYSSVKLKNFNIIDKAIPIAMGSSDQISFKVPPGPYTFTAEGVDTFGCDINPSNLIDAFVSPQLLAPDVTCVGVKTESLGVEWPADPQVKKYEVSLDSGKTWISPNDPTGFGHQVTGLTFGTTVNFRVRGKVFSYCQYSETQELTCKTRECFKVNYDVTADNGCEGDSARLQIDNIDLEKYGLAFNSKTYGTATRYAFSGDTGNYQVNISFVDSNALSCPSVDTTIQLRINSKPRPQSLVGWQRRAGENVLCADTLKKELTGTTEENGKAYTNYSWMGEGVSENAGVFELDPGVPGEDNINLVYAVTNEEGCEDSIEINVALDPPMEVSFTTNEKGRNVNFTQTISGATKWKWYFGDGDSSELENPSHYYNADGSYEVELRSTDTENVCPQASFKQSLDLVGDGISYAALNADVYPVPFTNVLSIKLEKSNEVYEMRLYDTKGQVVFENANVKALASFDLSHLNNGVYLLYLSSKEELMTQTVLKQ